MGPTEQHVAACLAGMIPVKGKLFTAEKKHIAIIEAAAKDRGCEVFQVDDADVESITDEEMAAFKYLEHKENVAVCLSLLRDLGIDRATALRGMWETQPDPGALTEHELKFFGRQIYFVNGFAANDPVSTELIWRRSIKRHPSVNNIIALFNLRGDRPDRTMQLARESNFWHGAHRIILFGSGGYVFARHATKAGFDSSRFIFADYSRVDDIFEAIIGACGARALVVGMGNIGGAGLTLVNYFKNRALPKEVTP
jgi:poly-gamma-glutamate synthase PgsB/CapB